MKIAIHRRFIRKTIKNELTINSTYAIIDIAGVGDRKITAYLNSLGEEMMMNTFGQNLRELRRSKSVTQRELAAQVGVDFSYISKVENDRLPPPAADTIMRICEALSVPPDELLAMTGKMPSQVKQMVGNSSSALHFMRQAQSMKITDEEWDKLTQGLKQLRSE